MGHGRRPASEIRPKGELHIAGPGPRMRVPEMQAGPPHWSRLAGMAGNIRRIRTPAGLRRWPTKQFRLPPPWTNLRRSAPSALANEPWHRLRAFTLARSNSTKRISSELLEQPSSSASVSMAGPAREDPIFILSQDGARSTRTIWVRL